MSVSVHPLPSALLLYLCGPRRLDMPTSAELSERVCLTTARAPRGPPEVSIWRRGTTEGENDRYEGQKIG